MKSSEILHLVDEYINKYKSEQTNKYETIYRVPASDASKMGPEFIRDDKARVPTTALVQQAAQMIFMKKMRWVAYYRNRISLFDKKVENLLEKYSPMEYRSGRNKIISNEKIKNTVRERQVISK